MEAWIVMKTEITNLHGGIDETVEAVFNNPNSATQYVTEKDDEYAKSQAKCRWEYYRIVGPFSIIG